MLIHLMRKADCSLDAVRDFDDFLADLPEGFKRVMFPARKMLVELLGAPDEDEDPLLPESRYTGTMAGEIIVTDANVFVVEIKRVRARRAQSAEPANVRIEHRIIMTVHVFGREANPDEFEVICRYLDGKFSVELEPSYYNAGGFQDLKAEGRLPPQMPTPEEVQAAEILSDKDTRLLLVAIRKASGLLIGDLSRQLRPEARSRAEEIRTSLERTGIVAVETVVICKKNNAQVARVPDSSVLAKCAEVGLKCACGNLISEERVDEAVSVTDTGQALLDSNRWFTILLINALVELAIPLDRILVDQVSGGDEMDCIADINGEIALFELKDKEFNLGNAYSFGAKIGILKPKHPIVITTEYVGNDAKEHFARSRRRSRDSWASEDDDPDVIYIEGMDNFKAGLMELVTTIALNDANDVFGDSLPLATLQSSSVLKLLNEKYHTAPASAKLAVRTRVRRRPANPPIINRMTVIKCDICVAESPKRTRKWKDACTFRGKLRNQMMLCISNSAIRGGAQCRHLDLRYSQIRQ